MIVLIAQLLWFGLCHYQYATAFTFNNLKHRPTYSNTYSNTFLLKTSLTAKTDQNNNVNCDKITSEEPTPFSLEGCTYCNDASSEVAPLRYLSENSEISFRGPSSQHVTLNWKGTPNRILLLAKPDKDIAASVVEAMHLLHNKSISMIVEPSLIETIEINYPDLIVNKNSSGTFISDMPVELYNPKDKTIDLIVTFGGDGLLLHLNTLFNERNIPPVMCFDFGSLGFLSPFYFEDFEEEMNRVLSGPIVLTLRLRLKCDIYAGDAKTPSATFEVLNEVVVDRGPSPYLSVIELSCDSQYLTTAQADGIIIATPTGSTAYSLAAGGSIVYPSVPAILLTPICAHSLSFRPMLLPDSAELTCKIPLECRCNGWVSFDGRHRQELEKGDRLVIKMSPYPLPTINRLNFTGDWFDALRAGFMFNLRPRQKSH